MLQKPLSFWKLLEEVFLAEQKDRDEFYKTYEYRHNPSSASFKYKSGKVVGACLRALYYKATKVPETNATGFTGKLQMAFGDALHSLLLGKLSKSKVITLQTESAGKIHYDPLTREISFRLDGLVGHDAKVGCLELKFKQTFAVQRRMKEAKPDEDSVLQVISYFGTNPLISFTNLCYGARDTALRAEFQITKEGDTYFYEPVLPIGVKQPIPELCFAGIVSRWHELEAHLEHKTEPQRDYKAVLSNEGKVVDKRQKKGVEYKTDWRCSYCNWCDHCWSQPDAKTASVQI